MNRKEELFLRSRETSKSPKLMLTNFSPESLKTGIEMATKSKITSFEVGRLRRAG
jgi:hypothetical protein